MMTDLVERLKKMVYIDYALMDEAASAILRLQEENAHHADLIRELVGALNDIIEDLETRSTKGIVNCSDGVYCNAKATVARVKEAGL